MSMVRRKTPWIGAVALLTLSGVGAGVIASSLTTDAIVWRTPSRWSATEQVTLPPIDQGKAGESWARTAFTGGLKRCPPINAAFLAACEAEMKLLAERPAFPAGSYGGPLLITKVETVSAPEVEPYRPAPESELELASYEVDAEPLPALEEPTPNDYPALREQ